MITAADVGRAMERLRGDRTQREVARRAGIHRSNWNSYERGNRRPNRDSQEKIARGLGCSLAELDRAILHECRRRVQAPVPGPAPPADPETMRQLYLLLDQLEQSIGRVKDCLATVLIRPVAQESPDA